MNQLLETIKMSDKSNAELIQKGEHFRILTIGLKTGVVLKKHTASDRAILFVS